MINVIKFYVGFYIIPKFILIRDISNLNKLYLDEIVFYVVI